MPPRLKGNRWGWEDSCGKEWIKQSAVSSSEFILAMPCQLSAMLRSEGYRCAPMKRLKSFRA